jgi:hypothetical protein
MDLQDSKRTNSQSSLEKQNLVEKFILSPIVQVKVPDFDNCPYYTEIHKRPALGWGGTPGGGHTAPVQPLELVWWRP